MDTCHPANQDAIKHPGRVTRHTLRAAPIAGEHPHSLKERREVQLRERDGGHSAPTLKRDQLSLQRVVVVVTGQQTERDLAPQRRHLTR